MVICSVAAVICSVAAMWLHLYAVWLQCACGSVAAVWLQLYAVWLQCGCSYMHCGSSSSSVSGKVSGVRAEENIRTEAANQPSTPALSLTIKRGEQIVGPPNTCNQPSVLPPHSTRFGHAARHSIFAHGRDIHSLEHVCVCGIQDTGQLFHSRADSNPYEKTPEG